MTGSAPYLAAGFVLTWAALALYAWRLEARVADAVRRLERREEEAAGGPSSAPDAAEGADPPAGAGSPEERER